MQKGATRGGIQTPPCGPSHRMWVAALCFMCLGALCLTIAMLFDKNPVTDEKDVVIFYSFVGGLVFLAAISACSSFVRLRIASRSLFVPRSWCQMTVSEALVLVWYIVFNVVFFTFWWSKVKDGDDPIPRSLGHLNDLNISLLLFPVARNSVWSSLFGISFERAIKFHRWIARVMFTFITCHMLGWWISWWKKGTFVKEALTFNGFFATEYGDWTIPYVEVAWLISLFMVLTSLEYFRRKFFELFYYSHHLFVVFLIFANFHSWEQWKYLSFSFVLYTLDRVLRFYYSQSATAVVSASVEGGSRACAVTRLEMCQHGFSHQPGQYLFLNIPAISTTQWHPFSVSSCCNQATFTCHIKNMGDEQFTGQLYRMVSRNIPIKVNVDGPYGALSLRPDDYDVIILVAGGIGITPMISLAHHCLSSRKCKKLYFIWTIRDPETISLSCFQDFRAVVSRHPRGAELVDLQIFQTGKLSSTNPHFNASLGDGLSDADGPERSSIFGHGTVSHGRPVFRKLFHQLRAAHKRDSQAAGVFTCGPSLMNIDVHRACFANSTNQGFKFDFHQETFAL